MNVVHAKSNEFTTAFSKKLVSKITRDILIIPYEVILDEHKEFAERVRGNYLLPITFVDYYSDHPDTTYVTHDSVFGGMKPAYQVYDCIVMDGNIVHEQYRKFKYCSFIRDVIKKESPKLATFKSPRGRYSLMPTEIYIPLGFNKHIDAGFLYMKAKLLGVSFLYMGNTNYNVIKSYGLL